MPHEVLQYLGACVELSCQIWHVNIIVARVGLFQSPMQLLVPFKIVYLQLNHTVIKLSHSLAVIGRSYNVWVSHFHPTCLPPC